MASGLGFTLDAVSKHAGVSKGGLLHHFPTKDALVRSLVTHQLDAFETEVDRRSNEQGETWLRAYVRTAIDEEGNELGALLMAAAAMDPSLRQMIRDRLTCWDSRCTTGAEPGLAQVVRLAVDGLWVARLLELPLDRTRLSRALDSVTNSALARGA